MGLQVVLTADNHLDPPAVMFGSKRYERKGDFLRCFGEVVDFALENKPDIFLVSGDFFDHIQPRNPTRTRIMGYFKSLYDSGIKVFLISGHHDTPKSAEQGMSPLAVYGRSGYAKYFQNSTRLESVSLEIDGLKTIISGMSYNPTLSWDEDPLKDVKLPKVGDVNIMLLHYPISGFKGYYANEPKVQPGSIPADLQLVAAGHLHSYQREKIGDVEVVYPGSTERVDFSEEGEEKGFVWLELDKSGVVSEEFIKTHAREMKTLEYKVEKRGKISDSLKSALYKIKDPELILRVRLLGEVSVKRLSTYRRADILSFAEELFFTLLIDESKLEIEDLGALEPLPQTTPLKQLSLYFQKRMEKAESMEKALLREALRICEKKLQEAGGW